MNNQNFNLPSWMMKEENYESTKDQDAFLTKTILGLFSLISRFRQNSKAKRSPFNTCIAFVGVLYIIILMSLSRNMIFTAFIFAFVIIRLILLDSKSMMHVLRSAFVAALLSFIVLIPAIFLGNPKSMLTISGKVFTSVALLNSFTISIPWNDLTESLRYLGLPDIIILILDLTIKFILELGTISLEMSEAMKLRSVGKNKHKAQTLSGILGIIFLKSKEMSEMTYQAMMCRGFEGEYKKLSKFKVSKFDICLIILLVGMTWLFIITEGWMS